MFAWFALSTLILPAALASRGGKGCLIENDQSGRESLIGYDRSKGYRDFRGLGWGALVVADLKVAFEAACKTPLPPPRFGEIVSISNT